MKLLIKQPAGLGDIFFCQKIAVQYSQKLGGCPVVWPVLPHFLYIRDYLKPIVNTEFVSVDDSFEFKEAYHSQFPLVYMPLGCFVLNLHGHTDQHGDVMKAKYEAAVVSWLDWCDYFHFQRNPEREEKLYNHLGLLGAQPYTVVNRRFASPPGILIANNVPIPTEGKVVEIQPIDGFNLFDWCLVLERAAAIHTVETSFCYLIEKLNVTPDNLYLYARDKAPNWRYIDGIYSKPWHYEK